MEAVYGEVAVEVTEGLSEGAGVCIDASADPTVTLPRDVTTVVVWLSEVITEPLGVADAVS